MHQENVWFCFPSPTPFAGSRNKWHPGDIPSDDLLWEMESSVDGYQSSPISINDQNTPLKGFPLILWYERFNDWICSKPSKYLWWSLHPEPVSMDVLLLCSHCTLFLAALLFSQWRDSLSCLCVMHSLTCLFSPLYFKIPFVGTHLFYNCHRARLQYSAQ